LYSTVLQRLHVGGGWLAFAAAPVALLAVKGSRRHVLAGRCFVLALTTGITAGLALAMIDHAVGLFFFGLLTLFLLGTGYLAPHIGRGSRSSYRWDRALTVVGTIGSLGLIGTGLTGETSLWEGLSFGGLGLGIAVAHARWRGPSDPSRWQVEHLTSLLAAYFIGWSFILALYAGLQTATGLVVPVLGLASILWARRRLGSPATGRNRAAEGPTGAA
jgi:uncharacterized membrane protein